MSAKDYVFKPISLPSNESTKLLESKSKEKHDMNKSAAKLKTKAKGPR